ncbi:MAG: methylenetetrahydrofolate--tRNA-(uracil(54)-C(5))-methyltransferase (FADH(2)-oxidizing) TrmFO, partial [Thermanaerothrix sp.]|nr:methylenetetrahydrofolate--tRNA-(uracil(54)-C(5))-methyltransferase (FADH(2)-oxidizing) TrmFO [Thermanaerothrix sp.]
MSVIHVIGGGLAGSEAAWQAAELGAEVILYEMRPLMTTGAHRTDKLAELICSNSLGSRLLDRASGLLKEELRLLRSLLLECAEATAVPAGAALAVDRDAFAELVTRTLSQHPRIRIVRQEVTRIPEGVVVVASGPLTSPALSSEIQRFTGENYLFFYDAISPIVTAESINMDIAFRASRYGRGLHDEGDYINCPMNKAEYKAFIDALIHAERIPLRDFEKAIEHGVKAGADKYFEGCLPIEVLATRGEKALAFGPLRPVGLVDPRTGKQPYAVVQLRQDNLLGTLYSLVGFQTNLTYPEQKRVFRMIPGLENAEFVRYGQMHRNTYIA